MINKSHNTIGSPKKKKPSWLLYLVQCVVEISSFFFIAILQLLPLSVVPLSILLWFELSFIVLAIAIAIDTFFTLQKLLHKYHEYKNGSISVYQLVFASIIPSISSLALFLTAIAMALAYFNIPLGLLTIVPFAMITVFAMQFIEVWYRFVITENNIIARINVIITSINAAAIPMFLFTSILGSLVTFEPVLLAIIVSLMVVYLIIAVTLKVYQNNQESLSSEMRSNACKINNGLCYLHVADKLQGDQTIQPIIMEEAHGTLTTNPPKFESASHNTDLDTPSSSSATQSSSVAGEKSQHQCLVDASSLGMTDENINNVAGI